MFIQDLFVLMVLYGSFYKTDTDGDFTFTLQFLKGIRKVGGWGHLVKTMLCKQVLLSVLKINGVTPHFTQS